MTRWACQVGFAFCHRPQAAIGDDRFTSQGSQQPPGSPLSREEGEAPPPAPALEGRRRSRRVRLRGSCRHRPSFLGRRELATSAPAGPAPASSEVSEIGNNGARRSEGLGEPKLPLASRPRGAGAAVGPEGPSRPGGPGSGTTAPAAHLWIHAVRVGGEGLRFLAALPRARARRCTRWSLVVREKPDTKHKTVESESWRHLCQRCDLGWVA